MAAKSPDTSLGQFDAWLNDAVTEGKLPGAQYLLCQDSHLLRDVSVGYSDLLSGITLHDHSLFRLASASKIFISALFLAMMDRGLLTLDDPLERFFPEFQRLTVHGSQGTVRTVSTSITLFSLLSHTCGFGYGDTEPYGEGLRKAGLLDTDHFGNNSWVHDLTLREWVRALSNVPLESEPGERVSYGLGHDILGAVIEACSGMSLDKALEAYLLAPMGLTSTFFVVPRARQQDLTSFYDSQNDTLIRVEDGLQSPFLSRPKSFSAGGGWDMIGNGGLVSSTRDFAALLQMVIDGGEFNGTQVLSEPACQLLSASTTTRTQGEIQPGCGYSFGVGCVDDPASHGQRAPKGTLYWGGSTNTYYFYHPITKLLGVFLTHTFPFGHQRAIFRFEKLANWEKEKPWVFSAS